jgi:hypothetical protein
MKAPEQTLDVTDLIIALRMPEITPEFEALHRRIALAKSAGSLTDELLQQCSDCECIVCGVIVCPHADFLHFHHDGCPSCSLYENTSD